MTYFILIYIHTFHEIRTDKNYSYLLFIDLIQSIQRRFFFSNDINYGFIGHSKTMERRTNGRPSWYRKDNVSQGCSY